MLDSKHEIKRRLHITLALTAIGLLYLLVCYTSLLHKEKLTIIGFLFRWAKPGFPWLVYLFLAVICGAIFSRLVINRWRQELYKDKLGKKREFSFDYQPYGDAHWAEPGEYCDIAQIRPLSQCHGIVLGQLGTQAEQCIDMAAPKRLNKHILAIGSSGSGKSFSLVEPYIMQSVKLHHSLIITDPKGELYQDTVECLKANGYYIRRFDLISLAKSDGWDCMKFLRGLSGEKLETNAQIFATIIVTNINKRDTDSIYALGGIALLKALLLYTILFKEIPEKDKNIGTINLLLQGAGMSDLEDKFNYASCVQPDEMKPAISAFNTFKQASPNLYGNIIAHVASGIQIIQTSMVERILTTDDIDLNLPGDKPCAYFCRFSATNNTFRFVSAMFFSMLFIALIEHADQQDTKRLKNEVHFLMDEFPSIGVIPDWLEKISNIRSYGITAVMIVQGITQIQNNYGDASTMIIGNCGTILNIGMNDEETAKWFQTRIGVTSIKVETQRIDNPGRAMTTIGSTSAGVGKDFLYPVSDIYQMPVDDVLIVFQHCSPIYAHKVPITAFPEFHKYPKASENDIPDITDFQARQRERVLEEKRIAEYNRKHPYKPVKPAPSNEKPVVFFGMTTLQVFLVVVKDDIRLAWEKIGYFACVLLASLKHFAFRVQDNDSQNVTPDTTEEAEKEDPPSPLLQFSFELPEFEPSSNENVSQGTQQAAQAEKASPPSPPPHPSQSSDKQIAVTGKNSPNETGTSNNTPEPSQRVQRPKSNLLGGMPVKRTHN